MGLAEPGPDSSSARWIELVRGWTERVDATPIGWRVLEDEDPSYDAGSPPETFVDDLREEANLLVKAALRLLPRRDLRLDFRNGGRRDRLIEPKEVDRSALAKERVRHLL